MQFTGRENDGEGLLFYRTRYYSSARGRFLSRDPIGFGGGINLYAYVENNPVYWSDAYGLDKCDGGSSMASNAAIDTGIFVGQQLGDAGIVRAEYDTAVGPLDQNDSAGRSAAKTAARSKTPPLVRYPLEAMRPSLEPNPASTGHANISNPGANALGQAFKYGGGALLAAAVAVDAYQVSTSCRPFKALMSASFGILGSIAGGTAGVVGGSFVTPVAGTIVGGVTGAAAGGAGGRVLGNSFYNSLFGP